MQKISTCLWFDNNADEAVKFYLSVFKKGKIKRTSYYTEGTHMPAGTVLTIEFELEGQRLMALNGGPMFKFSEAVSLVVDCDTQREIDTYTTKLTAGGGKIQPCGWVKDKYGLSWQIAPRELMKILTGKDKAKAARAMAAVMQMEKIDLKKVKAAAAKKS